MSRRITVKDIRSYKNTTPFTCLTAYSAPMATILDKQVDLLLVGDTVGMVLYGMDSTLSVDVAMMIRHGQAVVRASQRACVVVDLPFGSYQSSPQQAFETAASILAETHCQAVKLEGGIEMAETIEFLTQRGIPVMAHIGLQPQSVNAYGGYFYQGRTNAQRNAIIAAAKAVEAAGAFAVVLECVEASLAKKITQTLAIPTIGIGASVECDGQILVTEDMLGLFGNETAKFVKQYGNLAHVIEQHVTDYVNDVKNKQFPDANYSYNNK